MNGLPESVDSERGILGCLLTDAGKLSECMDTLQDGVKAFFDPKNQTVYETILKLCEQETGVDLITVQQDLRDRGLLEAIGGIEYLAKLQNEIPSAHNLPYYVEAVNAKYVARQVIEVCQEITTAASENTDPLELIDLLERKAFSIRPRQKDRHDIKQLARQALEQLQRMYEQGGKLDGLSTGLTDLDRKTGGLRDGEETVVAGYPGSGKTSLAMNIAEHVLLNQGKSVGVFSLEMSAHQLVIRCICSHAQVSIGNIRNGYLVEKDFRRITSSGNQLGKAAIYFEDDSDLSVYQLRTKARRMAQEHGIDLFVVDYLQLLSAISGGGRKAESRQQEVTDISRQIKAMSRELNKPVLALSQLNDEGKLRESRAIGQDADNVWILKPKEEGDYLMSDSLSVTLEISKARNGPTGRVPLVFRRHITRYENAARVVDETDLPKDKPEQQPELQYENPYR